MSGIIHTDNHRVAIVKMMIDKSQRFRFDKSVAFDWVPIHVFDGPHDPSGVRASRIGDPLVQLPGISQMIYGEFPSKRGWD